MDKYFMWIHYERLRNHNKAKHNKTVCMFLGIYCSISWHKAYSRFARNSFPNLTGLRMVMTTTYTVRNYMHIPLTNRSVCFHGYHSLYFLIKALTMMTSSHGNMSALLALWAGNSPVTGDAELWCFLSSVPEFTVEGGDLRRHCAHYDVIVVISTKHGEHVFVKRISTRMWLCSDRIISSVLSALIYPYYLGSLHSNCSNHMLVQVPARVFDTYLKHVLIHLKTMPHKNMYYWRPKTDSCENVTA